MKIYKITVEVVETKEKKYEEELAEEVVMVDLGYSNGWIFSGTPEVVETCTHEKEAKEVGRCLTEVSCKKCGYKFKTDSSD